MHTYAFALACATATVIVHSTAASTVSSATLAITDKCQTCTSDTQPDCMTVLETAHPSSSKYDSSFAAEVPCSALEFAFECILLENAVYEDGYLDYYLGLSDNSAATCEEYADVFDTTACNIECFESGGDVQEGAMEFLCEQCNEDTVEECYYYLGYSDSSKTCDSKQLALDCVTTNFTKYPEGYLAWMSSQRVDVTCADIANTYTTVDCTLHCGGKCPATCMYDTCDRWVSDNINTCAGLELLECDCNGCSLCDSESSPAPGPSDGWIVQTTTKCGRQSGTGLAANQLAIGLDGKFYDIVNNENFFVSDCKATCEAFVGCAGFGLQYGTTTECWYVADTRVYVSTSPSESCYTFRVNATEIAVADEVEKCKQCNSEVSFEDCLSLVDNAYAFSWDQAYTGNFCGDLQTALDCVTAPTPTYPNGFLQETTFTTCSDYLDSIDTGLCSVNCSSASSNTYDISSCTSCSATSVGSCYGYLQQAVHTGASCENINTAMSCLEDQEFWSINDIDCSTTLTAATALGCDASCPATCDATCNYISCDDIIGLTDVVTCAQMENAWGCDCSGCSCSSSAATLNALGYRSTVGTSCYSTVVGKDTNRVTIGALDAKTFIQGATVDDCAAYCSSESTCGGFTYTLSKQECIFVLNASWIGDEKGEYLCFENTGSPIVDSASATTTLMSFSNGGDDDNSVVVPVVATLVSVIVVGAIIAVIVWRMKDAEKAKKPFGTPSSPRGFSPQNKERPTTYAAPMVASDPEVGSARSASRKKKSRKASSRSKKGPTPKQTPKSIDEDRQIDQDSFEL